MADEQSLGFKGLLFIKNKANKSTVFNQRET